MRVVLRVRDVEQAVARLPGGLDPRLPVREGGLATFTAPEGLGLGLVEVPDADLDYDIDHVVLRVPRSCREHRAVRIHGIRARSARA